MKAVVISGGGAAIVQALDLFERHYDEVGKLPDMLVGNSAGGLLVLLIAHFHIRGAREEILKIKKREDIFSSNFFLPNKLGLWNARPLQKLLRKVRQEKPEPIVPYWVCAYDIKRQKTVYFPHSADSFWQAATACIPLLVEPIGEFVDGGITENTPLRFPIDKGATDIDVFMCSAPERLSMKMPSNIIEMGLRSFEAMRLEIANNDLQVCLHKNDWEGKREINLNVHWPKKNLIGVLEFERMREVYAQLKKEQTK